MLDANAGFFQLNIDAGWELEKIIDLSVTAEAYFDFTDLSAWHLYLGEDQPEERRIQADVLALFSAEAFLMIDALTASPRDSVSRSATAGSSVRSR